MMRKETFDRQKMILAFLGDAFTSIFKLTQLFLNNIFVNPLQGILFLNC